jgi:hypothetical protein
MHFVPSQGRRVSQRVLGRSSALAEEDGTTANTQPAGTGLRDRCKGRLKILARLRRLPSGGTIRFLKVTQLALGFRTVRVTRRIIGLATAAAPLSWLPDQMPGPLVLYRTRCVTAAMAMPGAGE